MKYNSPYTIPTAKKVLEGATPSFANLQNQRIAATLPFAELCQIIDAAIWISQKEGTYLYTQINRELYPYARDLQKVDSIIYKNMTYNRLLKGRNRNRDLDAMHGLYRVIGKKYFIAFYCPPTVKERTFRDWLDKTFADPERNKKGARVHPHRKEVLAAIMEGANIRVTERGSLYIISESQKIRISDHPTTHNRDLTLNIII